MSNEVSLLMLVGGMTLLGECTRVTEGYTLKKPLLLAPSPNGVALMPFSAMPGNLPPPDSLLLLRLQVVGDPVAAPKELQDAWLQASSGIAIARAGAVPPPQRSGLQVVKS